MYTRIFCCFRSSNKPRNGAAPKFAGPARPSGWRYSVLVCAFSAVFFLVALSWGHLGGAVLDEATLVQANTLHRQLVAAGDLAEKELMVRIIDRLDNRLTDHQRAQIGPILVEEARRYNFDPLLFVAIITTESSFGPREVSYMGARGLMQVKPSVAQAIASRSGIGWRHADQLFDPAYNVRLGTHYLFELVIQFQDVKKAIIAYNYGETAIRSRIRTGQKLPTAYFRRVNKNYRALREKFAAEVPWEAMELDLSPQ